MSRVARIGDFRGFLFDFDYTPGDREAGIFASTAYALAGMGEVPRLPEQIRRTIGMSLEDAWGS